jgi:hypothetical protein
MLAGGNVMLLGLVGCFIALGDVGFDDSHKLSLIHFKSSKLSPTGPNAGLLNPRGRRPSNHARHSS